MTLGEVQQRVQKMQVAMKISLYKNSQLYDEAIQSIKKIKQQKIST